MEKRMATQKITKGKKGAVSIVLKVLVLLSIALPFSYMRGR